MLSFIWSFMVGIKWDSVEQKENEWGIARKKLMREGKLLENGTKLERKDESELTHDFIIIDGKILVLSGDSQLNQDIKTELAEDESGNLFTLNSTTQSKKTFLGRESFSYRATIAKELGAAGAINQLEGSSERYVAYNHAGDNLNVYLRTHYPLSLDESYQLCQDLRKTHQNRRIM